jgi:hypothetical protein
VFKEKWDAEGDVLIEAPVHYLLQVQAQMACTGKDHGFIVVCVGGNKLYKMRVERHDKIIARIEAEVAAFWESIREGREPRPDFTQDGATISRLYSSGNGEWLDLSGDNHLPELCANYKTGKAQEKAGKETADAALAEIKAIVGNAAGASCQGFQIKFSDIAEGEVKAFTRKAYRRATIKEIAS